MNDFIIIIRTLLDLAEQAEEKVSRLDDIDLGDPSQFHELESILGAVTSLAQRTAFLRKQVELAFGALVASQGQPNNLEDEWWTGSGLLLKRTSTRGRRPFDSARFRSVLPMRAAELGMSPHATVEMTLEIVPCTDSTNLKVGGLKEWFGGEDWPWLGDPEELPLRIRVAQVRAR